MKKQLGPKTIDKTYSIEIHKNVLGQGSYGQVYRAYKLSDPHTKLACKVLSKQSILEKVVNSDVEDKQEAIKKIIKRTNGQISICQKISHPNIVSFHYFSETQNNIYLFMEYCEQNLAKFILTKGTLEGKSAVKMIKGIVSAVSSLYDHNIIHRDIKPENILLKEGEPKLADFGFAKQLVNNKDKMQTLTNIGTVLYMAPQLIYGNGGNSHYSIKCDVWSVGLLMYYILYGNLPWGAVNSMQMFKLILKQPIKFPPKSSVTPALKNCISRALIENEEDRIGIKSLQNEINQIWNAYDSEMDTQ